MGAPRFFMPEPIARERVGDEIALAGAVAHHALRVLRLREGDAIVLFDGRGGEWAATLSVADRRDARARLARHDPVEREARHAATLVQAVIASDPMELVVRKAVELGAAAIVPVLAARSQRGASIDKRAAHWRAVAIAACEQCGRNRVPPVAAPATFADWLRDAEQDAATAAMLAPEGERTLAEACRSGVPSTLIVGPEGGWTPEEIAAARRRGIRLAHLGSRVLRAETAAIAALAVVDAFASANG